MDGHAKIATADFQAFRSLFPGVDGQTYMDVAARGLISTPVRAAIDRFLDVRMVGGDKAAMFETVERARGLFARLIGAAAEEVALTKNISEGINAVASGIEWRDGDSIVICAELEHPANLLPWHNLARRQGVKIISVPAAADGSMPVAAMSAAVEPGTRVVAASTVTFSPGFQTDLAPLAAACKQAGALLLVDAAQSAGVVQTDVAASGIDVLAASTQKGLLGLYGMGFLYVRREVAEALAPVYLSRMGVTLEDEHEAASSGIENFSLAPAAKRFDLGNYNYIAAAAAATAMERLLDLGPAETEARVFELAGRMRTGLAQLGLPVFRSADGRGEAHLVAVGEALADAHDQVESPRMLSLHNHLMENGVRHSIRRGILRFSLHAYNDDADVDRVIDLARDWAG